MLVEGFRRVWPIHLQRLIMISASAGLWLVLCQRSSLLMVIGQRFREILRRHELIKVCTFFVVATVVLQVSEPYNRTGLTLLLKILISVWSVRSLELQTFFNCRKTAKLWTKVLLDWTLDLTGDLIGQTWKSKTITSQKLLQGLHNVVYLNQYFA